jgi:phosphoenolpyruvate synthase/pyruvate phosphate dikinase
MEVIYCGSGFYPKDVIVRMSDFKSNEYANLIGGKYLNPMRKPYDRFGQASLLQ